jgi:hypothetical protein
MKSQKIIEENTEMDSSYFDDLIRILNSNHTLELVDSDKYLFQILYSKVFVQMKEKSTTHDFSMFSNQIEEVLFSEMKKITEEYQNRLEIIMSNNDMKDKIFDFLSKQTYENLRKNISL